MRVDHIVIAVIPSEMCLASHDQMTESNAQNIKYSNYAHTHLTENDLPCSVAAIIIS